MLSRQHENDAAIGPDVRGPFRFGVREVTRTSSAASWAADADESGLTPRIYAYARRTDDAQSVTDMN
ncbi:MAG: hypothetical protein QOJ71_489 [Actinomycetota bacterium]|nr:hypothetical protein [Actinomycetota bacterium]